MLYKSLDTPKNRVHTPHMKTPEDRRKLKPKMFSKHFMGNIANHDESCFVTFKEYKNLEKRYLKLFKRYQKSTL